MTHILEDLSLFLASSPTASHAAMEIGHRLALSEFTPLTPGTFWDLKKGGKYFVIREGSIAAFVLPEKKPEKMAIVATHTDSPALKLKPRPEIGGSGVLQLGVELYGSPILHTWICRDLAVAGKVVVENRSGILEEHLVFFEYAPLIIPALAPHLDGDIYKKGLELNAQDHLTPIAAIEGEPLDGSYIETLLSKSISFSRLLDFDLYLVPLESPRFIGKEGEMLSSYRVDNLVSAHAALTGMNSIRSPAPDTLPIAIFWDHEEVGSSTATGASSPFFKDLLCRLTRLYQIGDEEEIVLRERSLCLSVDMAHAFNPNYGKKYDPCHAPRLGRGITLKYNGKMRYSTSAKTASQLVALCDRLGLKYQKFASRSDSPTGSTVGPIFSAQLGIDTADLGIPQLAMHAAREVIACQDHLDLCTLLTHFLGEA